jgi:hypothetical protein
LGFRFFDDLLYPDARRWRDFLLLRWQGGGVLDLAEQDPESRAE